MTASQPDNNEVRYEAELKLLTLMFVDLVDSLRLISSLNPEEVAEFQELVTNRVTEIAHRHEGTVASLAGDGVLFLFGAPAANSKHALNACLAALEMRDSIQSMSGSDAQGSLRIGLSSGEVLVRPIKTDIGWQYDPTGLAVHMGSRMEALAGPGMICATVSVYDLAKENFVFIPLKPQHVKGLEENVSAFSLEGEKTPGLSLENTYQTTFFGREKEMLRLEQVCSDKTNHGSKITVLIGDAGVGKSRLLFETQNNFKNLRDFRTIYFKGHYGFSEPFAIIRDCVYQFLQLPQTSTCEDFLQQALPKDINGYNTDQVKASLTNLYNGICKQTSNVKNYKIEASVNSYNLLLSNIRKGFQTLLNINRDGPRPIFILDEFLEFDDGSREVFLDTMSSDAQFSVNFILSMRSERLNQNFLNNFNELLIFRIDCLPERSSLDIVNEMLDESLSAHVDAHELVRRSGGNPLFIEELVKSCRRLNYQNSGDSDTDAIDPYAYNRTESAVLTALISERVDRLPRGAKDIIRVASILGEEFDTLFLLKVIDKCGIPDREISNLFSHKFLLRGDESDIERLRFDHPLVREVVHSSILRKDRLRIHRAAFDALEADFDAGDHAEALAKAHHANEAGLWEDAVTWFRTAGSLSNERAMNSQAITLYTSAIAASKNVENKRRRARLEIDLLIDMRNPLYQIGDLYGVVDRLNRAKEMARTADEPRQLGKILVCESHVNWLRGKPKEAYACATDANLIANANDDQALRVRAKFHSALACFAMGDCRQAATILSSVTEMIASGVTSKYLGVHAALGAAAESYRARSLLDLGEWGESIGAAANATALAENANDQFAKIIGDISSGIVLLGCGLIDRSEEFFVKANESVNVVEAKLMRPVCDANFGLMLITTGKLDDGCQYIERSVRDSAQIGLKFQLGTRYIFLSIARILKREFGAAREAACLAVEQANVSGEGHTALRGRDLCEFLENDTPPERAEVLRLFGKLSAGQPQLAGSLDHLQANGVGWWMH